MVYKVTFTLPDRELGKADIEFKVKKGGKMFGKLLVSKGSIVWRSKNEQRGKKLNWNRFDELMEDQHRRE